MNDSNLIQMMKRVRTFFDDPSLVEVIFPDGDTFNTGVEISAIDGSGNASSTKSIEDYYDYLMGTSNTAVPIGLKSIGFYSVNPSESSKIIYFVSNAATKSDVQTDNPGATVEYIKGTASSGEYVPLAEITLADLAFQKYSISNVTDSTNSYNHALWIVENSYPTLTIDEALSVADVNVDTFKSQVKTLYNISDSQVTDYTEMVVYGIVQYAVWKVNGSTVEGHQLGNEIKGTGRSELDKLYKYLINTNRDYDNYVKPITFDTQIKVSVPETGKELFKKTNTVDIYGPYSATYNALVENGETIYSGEP